MSEEAGSNVEISSDPVSHEIGSGEVESEIIEDSGLEQEIDGEAVDDLQEEVADAIEEGATETEIQELIETFKIKVNGQETDDVIPWVQKEINDEMQELFAAMPEKAMANYIGTKNLDRLRKTRLKKMPKALNKGRETGKATPAKVKNKKGINLNNWLRHGASLSDFDE